MDYIEFTGKTVDDAITEACQEFTITSDRLDYEIIEKGTSGFLGFNSKNAVIRARVKEECIEENDVLSNNKDKVPSTAKKEEVKEANQKKSVTSEESNEICKKVEVFLDDVFKAMNMEVIVKATYDQEESTIDVELSGAEMGVLIGKRGQTLDSLQYLVSLVVNKKSAEYIRVKVDTENYRQRRKETLENLAKNLSYKVKRTKRPVSLEPMNPYERRIIHSALQGDHYVTTHSEGEEPFRRVVITLKK